MFFKIKLIMDKITQTSFFYKKFSLILVVSMLCVAGTIYAQDTDGDTVLDQFDLDDDNDGILDTLESDCDLTGATNVGLIWDPNIFSGTEVNSRTNFNTGDPKVDRYEPSRFDASVGLPTEFAQLTVSNTGIGVGLTDLSSSDPAVNVVVQSGYYYVSGATETSAANAKLNNDYLEFSFTMRSDRTVILRSSNIQDVPTSVPGVYEPRGIDLRQSFTDPADFIVPMLVDFSYQIEISTDNFTTSTVLVPGKTTVRRADGTSFTNSADDALLPPTDPNFFQYEELDIFPFYQLIPNETYTIRMFIYSAEDQSGQGRVSFDNFRINVSDCTRFDTDNDGVADQFDLDSDGDGCPDAVEASGSFVVAGLTSSNNLADADEGDVDGTGVPLDGPGGSQTTQNPTDDYLDATVENCTDTDGDGVPDITDIDDDNDGILDEVECPTFNYLVNASMEEYTACPNLSTNSTIQFATGWSTAGATGGQLLVADPGTCDSARPASSWGASSELPSGFDGQNWLGIHSDTATSGEIALNTLDVPLPAGTYDLSFYSGYLINVPFFSPGRVQIAGITAGNVTEILGTVDVNNEINATNLDWQRYELEFTTTQEFDRIRFMAIKQNSTDTVSFLYLDLLQISAAVPPVCDLDMDNVPDQLDLDADGDGIPDNVEAQTSVGYIVPANDTNATYLANNGLNSAYVVTNGLTPVDTDEDVTPDYLDTDSDNAQTDDTTEAGITLSGSDDDNDGLDNAVDTDDNNFGPINAGITDVIADYPDNGVDALWRIVCFNGEFISTQFATSAVGNAQPTWGSATGVIGAPDIVDTATDIVANRVSINGGTRSILTYDTTFTGGAEVIMKVRRWSNSFPRGFSLEFSDDGSTWTAASSEITPASQTLGVYDEIIYTIPETLTGSYDRVRLSPAGGSSSLLLFDSVEVKTTGCTMYVGEIFFDDGAGNSSGGIFNDNIKNGTESATGLPTGLFVNIIQGGAVVFSAPVETDGSYRIPVVPDGNYTAVLTNTQTATTSSLPNLFNNSSADGTYDITVASEEVTLPAMIPAIGVHGCEFGILSESQYATGNTGGLSGAGEGDGAPDGTGVAVFDNSIATNRASIFTYDTAFTGGALLNITARYIDTRQDGVLVAFSDDGVNYTANSTLINGWTSTTAYEDITYTIPSSLTGNYTFIRVQGNSNQSFLNIDAIQVTTQSCNLCPAGVDAPILSSNTATNLCPTLTTDISGITASNGLANTTLTWHSGIPATDTNLISDVTALGAGVYYATFYNAANTCYANSGEAITALTVDSDSDCDGVLNSADVDDDNDGVLDVVECPPVPVITGDQPYSYFYFNESDGPWTPSPNNNSNYDPSSFGLLPTADGFWEIDPTLMPTATRTSVLSVLEDETNSESWFIFTNCVGSAGDSATIRIVDSSNNDGFAVRVIGADGSTLSRLPATLGSFYQNIATTNPNAVIVPSSGNYDLPFTIPADGFVRVEIVFTDWGEANGSLSIEILNSNGNLACSPAIPMGGATCDDDDDGIINSLDLDSDGDGCPDSVEAGLPLSNGDLVTASIENGSGGTVTSTTSTANAQLDTSGTDTTPEDGLNDSVDANGDGIPDYTSTYNLIALSDILDGCADFDNDGIGDLADIDDDNDGIVDAEESPSCFFLETEWTEGDRTTLITVTSDINSFNTTYTYENMVDGETANAQANQARYQNGQTVTGNTIIQFEFERAVNINEIIFQLQSTSSFMNTTVFATLQGSNDGTNWMDLTTSFDYQVTESDNEVNVFVTQNADLYSFYRLQGDAGTTTQNGIVNEVTFNFNDYVASKYFKSTCTEDLDDDGILNHLDLDSDGDDCPDSVEANVSPTTGRGQGTIENGTGGAVTTTTPNVDDAVFTFTSNATNDSNGDGLLDSIDGSTVDGSTEYASFYAANALDNTRDACLDSDDDGVGDLVDVDDDNDGILDTVECFVPCLPSNSGLTVATIPNRTWTVRAFRSEHPANTRQDCDDTTTTIGSLMEFEYGNGTYDSPNGLNIGNPRITTLNSIANYTTWNVTGGAIPGTPFLVMFEYTMQAGDEGYYTFSTDAADGQILFGNSCNGRQQRIVCDDWFGVQLNLTKPNYYAEGDVLRYLVTEWGAGSNWIEMQVTKYDIPTAQLAIINCDFDGDGITNDLDLDSDGDGCTDAEEAGVLEITGLTTGDVINGTGGAGNTTTSNVDNARFVFISPTNDTNNDGLFDAADGAIQDGMPEYRLTYQQYATTTIFDACIDNDNDGISDIADIDDDNDGVVDAEESPSCFVTAVEAVIPSRITSDFGSPDDDQSDGDIQLLHDGANTLAFNFDSVPSTGEGTTLFALEYPTFVNLSAIQISDNITTTATSRAQLYGSFDGAIWRLLTATEIPTNTTPIQFTIDQNAGDYQFYEIRMTEYAALSTANTIGEITATLATGYVASAHPKSSCTEDNDDDGILNHLDLDSDGDGCPDSVEANAMPRTAIGQGTLENGTGGAVTTTTTNVDNAQFIFDQTTNSGNDDTNNDGLLDSIDDNGGTGTLDGTPEYTLTYTTFALDKNTDACLDSDGDSIADVFDIDDDNDGILDTEEQIECTASGIISVSSATSTSPITDIGLLVDGILDQTRMTFSSLSSYTTDITVEFASSQTGDIKFELYNDGGTQNNGGSTASGIGEFDSVEVYDSSGALIYSQAGFLIPGFATGDTSVLDSTQDIHLIFDEQLIDATTVIVKGIVGYNGDSDPSVSSTFAVEEVREFLFTKTCSATLTHFDQDTDADGVPNRLDLDSDGDGCPDAVEAGVPLTNGDLGNADVENGSGGAVTSTVNTANAQLDPNATDSTPEDGLNDSVDANGDGIPDYNSTYETFALDNTVDACLDSDGDMIADVFDVDDDNDGILDVDEGCTSPDTYDLGVFQSDFNTTVGGTLNPYTFINIDGQGLDITYSVSGDVSDVLLGGSGTGTSGISPGIITNSVGNAIHINANDAGNDDPLIVNLDFSKPIAGATFGFYDVDGDGVGFDDLTVVIGYDVDDNVILPSVITPGSVSEVYDASNEMFNYPSDGVSPTLGLRGTASSNSQINPSSVTFSNFKEIKRIEIYYGNSDAILNPMQHRFYLDLTTFSSCTQGLDLDKDGIINSLDLDSDGDGCPDAVEGDLSFEQTDLSDASATLLNQPNNNNNDNSITTGYLGTTTQSVLFNLGTTVDTNPSSPTYGVPLSTLANTPNTQGIGGSQDVNDDTSCCDIVPPMIAPN